MNALRIGVGLVMFLAGVAAFALDVHVAWRTSASVHAINQLMSGAFAFAGLAVLFPKIARALVSYFTRAASAWPGGLRRTDPPPRPDVPPPPSVKEK